MDVKTLRIGLIGYGEVGKIFAGALRERGVAWIGIWDRVLAAAADATAATAMRAHAVDAGVEAMASMAALLERAEFVVSAVTASQSHAVAEEAARSIRGGAWFIDLNSASPGVKAASSRLIDAAGGRFVESAVMTSVPPYGIKVPMLLGGVYAAALKPALDALGFATEIAADEVGVASAIKMCRSVMIKGMEAIVIESFTTARKYGVEDRVLASLQETFPALDWEQQGSYFFSRVAQHGKRRAEEMREAAVTVREAGLEPHMASATAERQDWVAALKGAAALGEVAKNANWREYADRLLKTSSLSAVVDQPSAARTHSAKR
jgi:3-hydroxyisobutyrate dehydrogenase-like beta-hydroxyacid dehydrogenase